MARRLADAEEGRIVDLARHPDSHVTVAQLAAYWGVSEKTIRRDIDKGALKAVRVGSNALIIRIPIEEARRYGQPNT